MAFKFLINKIDKLGYEKYKIELGRRGEAIALEYLKKLGYKLITKNYNCPRYGEIDLIMQDENYLVFIEVRTKSNTLYGTPLETINYEKRRQIEKMARQYLSREKVNPDTFCRFDLIGIVLEKNQDPEIEYIKDAFIKGD